MSGSYDFIVIKPFFLNQIGNSVEFTLNISDAKRYELALETDEKIFHRLSVMSEEEFQWRVEVTIWRRGKLLDKQILGPLVAGWPMESDFDYFADISLGVLPELSSRFSTKEFVVKVVVKQTDNRYMDENLPVRIGIRPSPVI